MNFGTIAIGTVVSAYLALITRDSKRGPRRFAGKQWVEYGWAIKGLGLISLATATYAVATNLARGAQLAAIFYGVTFLLLSIYPFVNGFFWRIGYDDRGLHCHSPWRRNRFVPWTAVTSIRFSRFPQRQWIVDTAGYGRIRFNELVRGTSELFDVLKRHGICTPTPKGDWAETLARHLLSIGRKGRD